MINIDKTLTPEKLRPAVTRLFDLSAIKLRLIRKSWNPNDGTPVITKDGIYTPQAWTEWTRGFYYGSELLQYDATEDGTFLMSGRDCTLENMASHVTHAGVHDHGFNVISTYGNLRRLIKEGRVTDNAGEVRECELAIKASGAVQAYRWTTLPGNLGYVYSFNGPHSLFADTLRSMRVLAVSHLLGHVGMGEQDERINLLERQLKHMETTAQYNVYYGTGRDSYDVPGRAVHESIFNTVNGVYRCPSTQQGYSPFTTWTRGLAWLILGYAEQLEFLAELDETEFDNITVGELSGKKAFIERFTQAAQCLADYYISSSPTDGIPYWDTGAPGLASLGDYQERPSDPYNAHEPIDSSAAAIAAQGLLRLGRFIEQSDRDASMRYVQSGLSVAASLFREPYLSTDQDHQGLLLHSIYHRPNGWDHIPDGQQIPCGESSMWGDYHARELGLYIQRLSKDNTYYRFW